MISKVNKYVLHVEEAAYVATKITFEYLSGFIVIRRALFK